MSVRAIAAASVLVLAISAPVLAVYGSSAPAATTFSTGKLAAAGSVSATDASCTPRQGKSLGSREVLVQWTPSPSTFADGYEVRRATSSGGPYTPLAWIAGASTSSYLDSALTHNTAYYYVVVTTRNLWRSPLSNEAVESTPKQNCR